MAAGRILSVDLDAVESNARTIVDLCGEHGISVTGVTKGVRGHPEVARAMLRAGVVAIGDSRLENLARLRTAGIEAPLVLLRVPSVSRAAETVDLADVSLNSEPAVLRALSRAAMDRGRVHDVVVMVDLGDLREGVWPDQLLSVVDETRTLPGIRLTGIGANLTCFCGVLPTAENTATLVRLSEEVESRVGHRLETVSGGNSSSLPLIATGGMPGRIDNVRIGEGILLGRETGERRPWPGTRQDAFLLHAEVVELKRKPSAPVGLLGQTALGHLPAFPGRGIRDHALVNLGEVDTDTAALTPLDRRMVVIGATSDYLVLDVTEARGEVAVGDRVTFALGYSALATAATSPYVEVVASRHAAPGTRYPVSGTRT